MSTAARQIPLKPVPGAAWWTTAQWLGLALTVALLGGLVWAPDATLTLLWHAVIPLLPASFLVSPAIWRNVCPLATANMLTGRSTPAVPSTRTADWLGFAGLLLLLVMVPARRFFFNTNGPGLAVTVAAVVVLALLLGLVFSAKAGFCNGLCPVLPVERLYGQRPLVTLGNPRCSSCTLCAVGCIDLAPTRSIPKILGDARQSNLWLLTPLGAFAAAFPGFVLGYFLLSDVTLAQAPTVYGTVLVWMLASYAFTALAAALVKPGADLAILLLGGLAVGLYYWFTGPAVAEAFSLPVGAGLAMRAGALLLVLVWLVSALRSRTNTSNRNAIRTST